MKKLSGAEKVVIRKILFLLVVFCMAAPPAGAAIWLFGGKKQENKGGENAPAQAPKLFVPKQGGKPWALDGIVNKPQVQSEQIVLAGKLFKDMRPEMLTASYTPRTAEEMDMIAAAQRAWEGPAMDKAEREALARMEAVGRKREAALQKREAAGAQALVQEQQPVNTLPHSTPARKVIYNTVDPGTPTKVFKNYR